MVGDRSAELLAGSTTRSGRSPRSRVDGDVPAQPDRLQARLPSAGGRTRSARRMVGRRPVSRWRRSGRAGCTRAVSACEGLTPMLQSWLAGVVGAHRQHVAVGNDLGDHDEVAPPLRVEAVPRGSIVASSALTSSVASTVSTRSAVTRSQKPMSRMSTVGYMLVKSTYHHRQRGVADVDLGAAAVERRHGPPRGPGRGSRAARPSIGADAHLPQVGLGDRGGRVGLGRLQVDRGGGRARRRPPRTVGGGGHVLAAVVDRRLVDHPERR